MKPIKLKPRQGKETQLKTLRKKLRIGIWSASLGIATLLGYAILLPRVTPTVSDPVDPNNPFSASVTLTNNGLISLESLDIYVVLNDIQAVRNNGSTIQLEGSPDAKSFDCESNPPQAVCMHSDLWKRRTLAYDDAIAIDLNQIFSSKEEHLQAARIAVEVSYKLPFGWKRSRVFPLYAIKQTNGNWYWRRDSPPT